MPALPGKVALVIGNGTAEHRAVSVALAESGASIAVAGNPGIAEVLLHSIANEIWAIGPKSMVAGVLAADDAASFAAVAGTAQAELGGLDLVVRVEAVLTA
jgi:NAD(P)-dependent dehydrogenase (short-subunit alcohol dehydrogenase family)